MSEPQAKENKQRVRGKSVRTQLQQALNEAASASGAGSDEKKLIQARLIVLSKLLRFDKIRKLRVECETLRAENERLAAEVARLRKENHQSPVTLEIEQALAKYRGETAADATF
jgi:hypothetical protein